MCGITGFIDFSGRTSKESLERTIQGMAGTLHHRGPDEGGHWVDAAAGLALGHRRLSIVDLSAAGRQPMVSASGRFVLSYNGEIYNADELKVVLGARAPAWRGHSDTEVLLEASAVLGVEAAISQAVGMFAYALFDRETRTLWLVRDRLGKKPLYYARQGHTFIFGSELRALRAHPDFSGEIDRDALTGFVRRGYYLQPQTVYRGVSQLEPGSILKVSADGRIERSTFWSLQDAIGAAQAAPFAGSADDAVGQLSALLSDAVGRRMVADVPVGAFLSGGYDSSTVVALMQRHASRPVRTFSIGFEDAAYNEAGHAAAVAKHLGTEHRELIVTAAQAREVIPLLPQIYDEPFADSSQIPTYLVSKLAREDVIVALSGDGGDELFAGYNRYHQGEAIRRWLARLPEGSRRFAARGMRGLSTQTWDRLAGVLPSHVRPRYVGDKIHKLAGILDKDALGVYAHLTSLWADPGAVVIEGREREWPTAETALPPGLSRIETMQYFDTVSYLPGDILTKVDRASMAVSLEARTPLLDHRVAAFAWSLPLSFKLREGAAKWVLRQVLYQHVPPALVDRPKTGFGIPVGDWLRGPLRDWAETLLDARALREGGLLEPSIVRARWAEHLEGRRNWQYALWNILMFQAWHAHQAAALAAMPGASAR
jgi:asparagine synthase (glutamine-hydrolysing)